MSRTILIEVDEERFDSLKKRSKSKSDTHLIAKALAVYNFLIEGKTHEHVVIVKTATGDKEFRVT